MGSRTRLFNVLTVVILIATVCLMCCYGLIGFNVFNPFRSSPPPTLMILPTATITPTPGIPTWTPTNTPTVTPKPSPTSTRTPTLTPSPFPTLLPTPTFPPTATETPRATLSRFKFTYEVNMGTPQYGCSWTGVAGHVQDLDGNPLIGYPVHIWGAGLDVVVSSGAEPRFSTIYGKQSAWEQSFDTRPKSMRVEVQLHDPYHEEHLPISDVVTIDFQGFCGGALGYVTFIQNH